MVPPALVDYALSRHLADGVVIAGCAEHAGYHRLGVMWMQERLKGERDPRLRARVPRGRIRTIWASRTEHSRFTKELAEFTAAVIALPPNVTPARDMDTLRSLGGTAARRPEEPVS
jgi:coenzyme F420-reducing hydrogenase delta subunit